MFVVVEDFLFIIQIAPYERIIATFEDPQIFIAIQMLAIMTITLYFRFIIFSVWYPTGLRAFFLYFPTRELLLKIVTFGFCNVVRFILLSPYGSAKICELYSVVNRPHL